MSSLPVTRRSVLAAGAATLATSAGIVPSSAAVRPVVVELFTSQGCSSCPPADAFMGDLAGREGIIGLSLNVDYWDYIGWRDTLASPTHTRRQRSYAARRGDGRVYTPQMVINGRDHAVGSDRGTVLRLIEREQHATGVAVSIIEAGAEIAVTAAVAEAEALRQRSTLLMMSVTPAVAVAIERGENTGSTVTYHNVVRSMMPVGSWRGDGVEIRLAKDHLADGKNGCVCLLQADDTGHILGAAAWRPG